jgi:hypothetical protein
MATFKFFDNPLFLQILLRCGVEGGNSLKQRERRASDAAWQKLSRTKA